MAVDIFYDAMLPSSGHREKLQQKNEFVISRIVQSPLKQTKTNSLGVELKCSYIYQFSEKSLYIKKEKL